MPTARSLRSRHSPATGSSRLALLAIASITAILVSFFWTLPSIERSRRLDLARRAIADHDDKGAVAILEPLVSRIPSDGEAAFLLARAVRRCGDRERATRLTAWARQGGALTELVDLEEALLRLGTTGPGTGQGFGLDADEAKALLVAARTGHPEAAVIYEALVDLAVRSFAMERAHAWASEWIAVSPDDWLPRVRRGDIRARFSLAADARQDYEAAIARRDDAPGAHAGLGIVLVRQLGDAAAAQPHLREALRTTPEDVSCLSAFAESLVRTSHIVEAESILDRALAIRPDDPTGLRLRGLIDLENGLPEDAIVLLERAERADPGSLETVAALARALALAGRDEAAREASTRAVTLRQEAESLDPLIKQVLHEPGNADVRFRIGRALTRMGRLRDAREWLESALAFDPDHADARRVLESLDSTAERVPDGDE
ncbi:MAG: tetratricopeptide repeat protein [Planctomycetaceae bacterium]